MGGLGPGIGGLEYIVIGLVALLVLGPERLPVMMRKVGQWVGKARSMAAEFRSSFDEMARQSELDDLRKEVEALRTHQGIHRLGADADAAFREIRDDLNGAAPTTSAVAPPAPAPALTSPDGWSEVDSLQAAPTPPSEIEAPAAKPRAKRPPAKPAAASARSPAKPRTKATSATAAKAKPKPAARKPTS